jgi:negative regulator of sigma E activity
LIEELLVVGQEELKNPPEELRCREISGVRIDDRVCRMIEFTHPEQRDHYRYHIARIFVDEQLDLPIRHASYDWPDEEGGKPKLLEEYTYLNLKLNVGLTDWDFDHRNEEYDFLKQFEP